MVFQSAMNSLNPVMTVGDQIVDIFTTHEGLSKKQARARAAELLELVRHRPGTAEGPTRTSSPAACASAWSSPWRSPCGPTC